MKIDIRPGVVSDILEISQMYDDLNDYLASHINYPGWRKGIYPALDDAQKDAAEGGQYVAICDGRIVGSIVLNHEAEQPPVNGTWGIEAGDAEVLAVHRLVVHPEFLRHGIATMLLDFADEIAKRQNIKALRLDVYENNAPAIATYEKCGYARIDKIDLGLGHYGLNWFYLYEKLV